MMQSKLSKKQLQILAFPNTNYDALICDGSIRAGKSSVMSVAFLFWAMRDFDKKNFAICSKTSITASRNVVKPLLSMRYIQDRFDVQVRMMGNELIVKAFGHENYFYVYGGSDERSYTKIQGITLAGVLLDEVAIMPRSFVEQAIARCSVDGRKLWFNCNPDSPMHWFYTEWIQKAEKHNALHLHFSLDDNPALSEKIKADYRSMYSGVFYARYILGQWAMADGLIYDMFDKDRHVVTNDSLELENDYYISSDYGIQNATVFLLWRKEKYSPRWVCTREYYYSGRDNMRQKTVKELTDGLEAILPRYKDGANTEHIIMPEQVIVDPSATALIVELRTRGYTVQKAKNEVLEGISDVSTMLYQDNLLFYERCKNTLEEFGTYSWDEKACQRGEDAPIKVNDHAMDAIRYFVKTKKLVRRNDYGGD